MNNEEMKQRGLGLVKELNAAADAYYNTSTDIMSDYDYDMKRDELKAIEDMLGSPFPNSPTVRAGYEVHSGALKKVTHEEEALSLDKTKIPGEIVEWLGQRKGMLSWKMDGLTLVLTYDDGKLVLGATRGNGLVGENVSHNILFVAGIPMKIPYDGHMIVRGETYVTYEKLKEINDSLPEGAELYKNCRNLASGSIRLLDSYESKQRGLQFKAFELVKYSKEPECNGFDMNDFGSRLDYLKSIGFDVVDHVDVTADTAENEIIRFESLIPNLEYPTDGLVFEYSDIEYGHSLGKTSSHPLYGKAFKWKDEMKETTLRQIKWQTSISGRINPVAIFDPIELEGTTVQKATLFDASTVERMQLGKGSKITVYKANMIIPKVHENIEPHGEVVLPSVCPVCGSGVKVMTSFANGHEVKVLYCENDDCAAKNVKRLARFTERNCMDIRGVSQATVEQLVNAGLLKEFADYYHLSERKEAFIQIDGLGEKSFNSLIDQIEKSRNVSISHLIPALGITGIGKHDGKTMEKELKTINAVIERFETGRFADLTDFGSEKEKNITEWYAKNKSILERLLKELQVQQAETHKTSAGISGKTFVITGKLVAFANRDALVKVIEDAGGKVSGSVSKNTDFLINNDTTSASKKNKQAKDLGIPVISEADFVTLL